MTAVAMSAATAGASGSGMDGMRGKSVGLICWCCSVGWWACPAGMPDEAALEDLALGDAGVLDGLALPAMSPARVGLGLIGAAGVLGMLSDSVVGALVTRGISGS
ncbi:hypothetical protein [Mycobacteroides abscessus]|uniref:hypothetical protein n=1 Tax=Mycobacteroides abscessus TaxID=36809 RepID=UPI001F34ECDB|nr:hypothetical protein [Mycobacteroides abscessus]MDO3064367.1 hypothetical protein [Mycobacteroides abscessus subsp. abscessus]MDO3158775.1 hypothetical protein [Mycobacteroides abscessus subsp. abscessus]MDO3236945.1 hypothetical protein [Mycobacteroides abscessus subsp. abscessus]MDO3294655.1 hypothetical protein [Mycobacteroides abscessus subsp. abscessus]